MKILQSFILIGGPLSFALLWGVLLAEVRGSRFRLSPRDIMRRQRQIAEIQSETGYELDPAEAEALTDLASRDIVAFGYRPNR